MTPAELRARAYAAQALIDDPTLRQGWQQIEDELRAEWEACWFPYKRNRIWSHLRHLRALRTRLASFAGQARD